MGFLLAGCLIATQGFANIYMSSSSSGVPGPIQYSTGVTDAPGPTTYPSFAQPPGPLTPEPLSTMVTKAPTNPQAYQQIRSYVALPPNPPGTVPYVPPCAAATPCQSKPVTSKPLATTSTKATTVRPAAPTPRPTPLTPYYVTTGSLRDNVNHMVAQSGWGRVIWDVPYDYRWVGDITIHALSIQDALSQLLDQYPVQAIFYEENHVVDIVPRRQA